MKRRNFFVLLLVFLVNINIFADTFTDIIQDLAMQTACIGQYSMTEVGGGWYDDPQDYYTPQMIAERLKNMSGDMTRTITFYGVCFDYAQFAYNDLESYQKWYNDRGLYENKYWMAGTHENSNETILQYPGNRNNYTTKQNGVYVIIPDNGVRNVKTHKNLNGIRATYHAWVWIERADGLQFWIDPTWTDNLGYVVYGYVKNGEEIQCRPDEEYCVNYPSYLYDLPLPPAMGPRKAPSKSANSTDRNEILQDTATEWTEVVAEKIVDNVIKKPFVDVDYSHMKDEYIALILSANVPFTSFTDKQFDLRKINFSLEMPWLLTSGAGVIGLEYLQNMEDGNNLHGGLLSINFSRRFFNNLAWYLGGGAGLRFDFSNQYGAPKDNHKLVETGYFAWKVNTGFIINLSRLFTKIDASYDNVLGFSVGAGLGFGLEL